jgi:hypothetical protein
LQCLPVNAVACPEACRQRDDGVTTRKAHLQANRGVAFVSRRKRQNRQRKTARSAKQMHGLAALQLQPTFCGVTVKCVSSAGEHLRPLFFFQG